MLGIDSPNRLADPDCVIGSDYGWDGTGLDSFFCVDKKYVGYHSLRNRLRF